MFFRLTAQLKAAKFDRQIADIRRTAPLRLKDAPWTILTMISPRHVLMYLLSLKCFYKKLGSGKVLVIADRMTERALATLRAHVPGISFVALEDIDTGACQRGGTWERLVYLLDHSRAEYVIQMDCDTLAVGADVKEVADCVRNNIPFTMADGWKLESMYEAAASAAKIPGDYVGIAAERMFDRYPGGDRLLYVRGSAGFAGFSRNGFSRASLEDFHRTMETLMGQRWREWGSEQCGSNFAIANSPGAKVLPYPEYTSFFPGANRSGSKLYHFIGAHRYEDGFYADRAREALGDLHVAVGWPGRMPGQPQNR